MRLIQFVVGVWFLSIGTAIGADSPASQLFDLVVVPDVNGNASDELALLFPQPAASGAGRDSIPESALLVMDARSGVRLAAVGLVEPGWTSLSLVSVPNPSSALVGVLQQHSGGAIRVRLHHARTGEFVRDLHFLDTARTAVAAALVAEAGGPGTPGVAVLALNMPIDERSHSWVAGEEAIVEVREIGGALAQRMYYLFYPAWNYGYWVNPLGFESLLDHDGNGSSEIAVLAQVEYEGGAITAIRAQDARTAETVSLHSSGNGAPEVTYFDGNETPVGFAAVADANSNGEFEIAVLGRGDGSRSSLQSRDVLSGALVFDRADFTDWDGRFVRSLDGAAGMGKTRIAAAGVRADGRIAVYVLNGRNGAVSMQTDFLSPRFEPLDLEMLGDLSRNGRSELALLGRNRHSGSLRIQIRDSKSGFIVRDIKVRTAQ